MDFYLVIFSVVIFFHNSLADTVEVWLTTQSQNDLLSPKNNVSLNLDSSSTADIVIDVDDSIRYQEIDGFGGDMTESAAWLMNRNMNATTRRTFLRSLFHPHDGIGLGLLRLPMGASEFSVNNRTYDDTCCDLSDFTIDRDKLYIVPLLRETRNLNPEVLIVATSFSPPAWMKTNNSLIGGKLRKNQYSNLATYFTKFVKTYQEKLRIPIYAIVIQNRPLDPSCCSPSMSMSTHEQAELVKTKLGPVFRKYNITTKILLYGESWDGVEYPLTLLSDPDVKGYATGTAFDCNGGYPSQQSSLHKAHPDRGIWLTDCMDGTWNDGGVFPSLFANAMTREIIGGLRNWAKGVAKGSLLLDENHGPNNGGCQFCLGLATLNNDGEVRLNAAYYALGHFSKFVQKGAFRIYSSSYSGGVETVAFSNPDGKKVLVAFNRGHLVTLFKVRWGGDKSFFYNLPSWSAVTFVLPRDPSPKRRSPFERIEAESGEYIKVVRDTERCDDPSGGCGEYVNGGDTMVYRGLDFGEGGVESVAVRVSSLAPGALQFQLDSNYGSTVALVKTFNLGDPDLGKWKTISRPLLTSISGVHDLYVVFRGRRNVVRLNWFVFNPKALRNVSLSEKVFYRIVDRSEGLSLTMVADQKDNQLQLRPYDYEDTQKFRLRRSQKGDEEEDDCYEMVAKKRSNRSANEIVRIVDARDGYLGIVSCQTNRTLTVDGGTGDEAFSFVAVEEYARDEEPSSPT